MKDTNAEVEKLQDAIHARMTVAERLDAAIEASLLARDLALARVRAEHPEWPEPLLLRELLRLSLLPSSLPPSLP